MKFKPTIALLAAITAAASAQTTAKKTTTTAHTTSSDMQTKLETPATPLTGIPKVEGTPKDLYALRYIDITVGTGPLAESRRYYTVHYTGWLADGTKFDSSYDHPGGQPIAFPYGARQVISGWDTGFEGMHIGGKRRLFIPYQLAYGESGRPPVIPPKADLVFDVELISQSETPPAPEPEPAAEQPADEAKPQAKPPVGDANQESNPSAPQTTPHPQTH